MIFKTPLALLTKQRDLELNLAAVNLEIIMSPSLGTKKYIKDKESKC